MRERGFLLVAVAAFFFLTFVCPVKSGISGTIGSGGHTAYIAGAHPAQNGIHNEITPLSGTGSGNNMLQFRAGGHVLGFQPDKLYLAGMDHALSVEFLDTKGVTPRAASAERGALKAAPALRKVTYAGLWPGISLVYETAKDGITESTYHLAAGADVSNIRLRYNVPVEKQKGGSLRFGFATGFITESAPVAWQEIEGRRVAVEASFKVSKNDVGFSVAKYDARFPLIIDPTFQWLNTYGAAYSDGNGIAVDGSGNVYVTGYSELPWGAPINPFPQASSMWPSIFVAKLNSSGSLVWNTFYGPPRSQAVGNGIAVDNSGNVFVTGYSNGGWGAPLHAYTAGDDIFVLKLNRYGAFQWNTFYGSGSDDAGYAIAVSSSNNYIDNIYVTGDSNGTWGSPFHAYTGGADVFVMRLGGDGALLWNTFYGSSSDDAGHAIAVDGSGDVYVTGDSNGTWGSPLHAYNGGTDIVVMKLYSSGGALQWNTFYGSSSDDAGDGVAVDGSGNVYVTGDSNGTWGAPINAYAGGNDIVVLKLNSGGALQWNTFYGSGAADVGDGIAFDGSGDVYVTGYSVGTWGAPLHAYTGGADIVVMKLNSSGALQWNTFYGSGYNDYGTGIALDALSNSNSVYVVGTTFHYDNVSYSVNNYSSILSISDALGLVPGPGPGTGLVPPKAALSVPTMTEWGMIIFLILAGLGAIYALRRRQKV